MLDIILFVVALVAAIVIVNFVYNLIGKVVGADVVFFSMRTKLIWYGIVFGLIVSFLQSIFG